MSRRGLIAQAWFGTKFGLAGRWWLRSRQQGVPYEEFATRKAEAIATTLTTAVPEPILMVGIAAVLYLHLRRVTRPPEVRA